MASPSQNAKISAHFPNNITLHLTIVAQIQRSFPKSGIRTPNAVCRQSVHRDSNRAPAGHDHAARWLGAGSRG
jgi:hypothetical protein